MAKPNLMNLAKKGGLRRFWREVLRHNNTPLLQTLFFTSPCRLHHSTDLPARHGPGICHDGDRKSVPFLAAKLVHFSRFKSVINLVIYLPWQTPPPIGTWIMSILIRHQTDFFTA